MIPTIDSGLKLGWVENKGMDHWSATYAFHDGYQQRTINTDGEATVLEVEIVSSSGEIGMTVTDENGNVIFDQQGIETSSFEIEISGKVTVKITGSYAASQYDHKDHNRNHTATDPDPILPVDMSGSGIIWRILIFSGSDGHRNKQTA